MMRILHINDSYECVGGAETYIKSVKKLLEDEGHEFFYFGVSEKQEIKKKNLFVYKDKFRRGPKKYFLWCYFNPVLYHDLKNWIESVKPDVIHIHNNGKFTSTIQMVLNKFDVPKVQTVHDTTIVCPTALSIQPNGHLCDGGFGLKCPKNKCISIFRYLYEKVPYQLKQYLIKNNIDYFITPSKALKKYLEKNDFKNVSYLPNFIDFNNFHLDPIETEDYNLLYVGRLKFEKGLQNIINIMPNIIDSYPSCILNVAGDGPDKEKFLKMSKELNIENNVKFYGKVNWKKLKSLYQKATVIVVPSIWFEAFGLVVLESMAFGKPVIASKIGGLPELILNGKTGFLVKPNDSVEIKDKIFKILSNKKLALNMGKNAKKICFKKYGPKIHYKKLMEIYAKRP